MTPCSPKIPESITLDVIRSAAKKYGVDTWGFIGTRDEEPFEESSIEMVEECCKWMAENTIILKTYPFSTTSYYLKHVVERTSGVYIANGAFIISAILMGFGVKQATEFNAHFNMRVNKRCLR